MLVRAPLLVFSGAQTRVAGSVNHCSTSLPAATSCRSVLMRALFVQAGGLRAGQGRDDRLGGVCPLLCPSRASQSVHMLASRATSSRRRLGGGVRQPDVLVAQPRPAATEDIGELTENRSRLPALTVAVRLSRIRTRPDERSEVVSLRAAGWAASSLALGGFVPCTG